MPLTKTEVLAAALEILDSYGLADLSMRRLAADLGVQPGALYYHVANKQTLLVELADVVLADLEPADGPAVDPDADPSQVVRDFGARLYALLRKHRSGAELVSAALAMRPVDESPATGLAARLERVGVDADDAQALAHGTLHLVLGHALDDEQRRQYAQFNPDATTDGADPARLDRALQLLGAGLAALATTPP
ncbi:TetR/AcrR family transcriptional regulator [Propionibacteriaceae bacterium G1746]